MPSFYSSYHSGAHGRTGEVPADIQIRRDRTAAFKTLELSSHAKPSLEEIKGAYRRLILVHHPDKQSGSPASTTVSPISAADSAGGVSSPAAANSSKFLEIQKSYQFLCNDIKNRPSLYSQKTCSDTSSKMRAGTPNAAVPPSSSTTSTTGTAKPSMHHASSFSYHRHCSAMPRTSTDCQPGSRRTFARTSTATAEPKTDQPDSFASTWSGATTGKAYASGSGRQDSERVLSTMDRFELQMQQRAEAVRDRARTQWEKRTKHQERVDARSTFPSKPDMADGPTEASKAAARRVATTPVREREEPEPEPEPEPAHESPQAQDAAGGPPAADTTTRGRAGGRSTGTPTRRCSGSPVRKCTPPRVPVSGTATTPPGTERQSQAETDSPLRYRRQTPLESERNKKAAVPVPVPVPVGVRPPEVSPTRTSSSAANNGPSPCPQYELPAFSQLEKSPSNNTNTSMGTSTSTSSCQPTTVEVGGKRQQRVKDSTPEGGATGVTSPSPSSPSPARSGDDPSESFFEALLRISTAESVGRFNCVVTERCERSRFALQRYEAAQREEIVQGESQYRRQFLIRKRVFFGNHHHHPADQSADIPPGGRTGVGGSTRVTVRAAESPHRRPMAMETFETAAQSGSPSSPGTGSAAVPSPSTRSTGHNTPAPRPSSPIVTHYIYSSVSVTDKGTGGGAARQSPLRSVSVVLRSSQQQQQQQQRTASLASNGTTGAGDGGPISTAPAAHSPMPSRVAAATPPPVPLAASVVPVKSSIPVEAMRTPGAPLTADRRPLVRHVSPKISPASVPAVAPNRSHTAGYVAAVNPHGSRSHHHGTAASSSSSTADTSSVVAKATGITARREPSPARRPAPVLHSSWR